MVAGFDDVGLERYSIAVARKGQVGDALHAGMIVTEKFWCN